MSIDPAAPSSRRALLGAALGAGVATVASALGRPLPARAVDGQALFVGSDVTATLFTRITNTTNANTCLVGESSTGAGLAGVSNSASGVYGSTNTGYGVFGTSTGVGYGVRGSSSTVGVKGESTSGTGVYGISGSNRGVIGISDSNVGVFGSGGIRGVQGNGPIGVFGTGDTSGIGVSGQSVNSVGVRGTSTSSYGVQGISSTGAAVRGESTDAGYGVHGSSSKVAVFGSGEVGVEGLGSVAGVAGNGGNGIGVEGRNFGSTQPATVGWAGGHAAGVFGYSNDGSGGMPIPPAKTGVFGYAVTDANSRGVTGQSTAGRGVNGIATTGTGLYGVATTGYALRAVGRVKLDKCAGVANIASGTSSVVVTPGVDLVTTSAVVATLMGNAGASTAVKRVAVNTTNNTFTIYLTANSTAAVKVAWHVFG